MYLTRKELIPKEFYFSKDEDCSFIMQFKSFNNSPFAPCFYYFLLNGFGDLFENDACIADDWILATQEQKLKLIHKVNKETGKKFNLETKIFE